MKTRYQLKPPTRSTGYGTTEEAARLSGMHPEVIEALMRACMVPSEISKNGVHEFDQKGIERLRQIQKLRKNRRPVLRYIKLIFSLADELAETKRELESLRSKLRSQQVAGISREQSCAGSLRPRRESWQNNPESLA